MLDVCLLGTSGMMPLPGRWLTSLMTRYNGSSLLIDCGEGTQIAIREKGWSFHSIDIICITHFHGDHISGLPGLLLSMGNAERKEALLIVGPRGIEKVVNSLRIIAPELPFEINFKEIQANEESFNINGYNITAFRVNHNIICYGYSITIKRGGKFYPENAITNNIPQKYWNRLQKGEIIKDDSHVFTPEMVLGPERKGIKLTYCTDSRPTKSIIDNAKESDLFICEGMYGEESMQAKAKSYKHMTFYEAAKIAKEAEVLQLWLTHFSPSLIRPKDYIRQVRSIFKNTFVGVDGKTITLEFEKDE